MYQCDRQKPCNNCKLRGISPHCVYQSLGGKKLESHGEESVDMAQPPKLSESLGYSHLSDIKAALDNLQEV